MAGKAICSFYQFQARIAGSITRKQEELKFQLAVERVVQYKERVVESEWYPCWNRKNKIKIS